MGTEFQCENGKERNNLRDLVTDGSKYLKWILKEVLYDEVYGIDMDQERDQLYLTIRACGISSYALQLRLLNSILLYNPGNGKITVHLVVDLRPTSVLTDRS
jgi:hypothetical protein